MTPLSQVTILPLKSLVLTLLLPKVLEYLLLFAQVQVTPSFIFFLVLPLSIFDI